MKITGYTIIYNIIIIILLFILIKFEIFIYNDTIVKNSDIYPFITFNIIIIFIILFALGITGNLKKIDELLKKRIL